MLFKHKIKCYEQISKSMFYLYEKGMPWRSYIYTETELKFGQWNEEKNIISNFFAIFFLSNLSQKLSFNVFYRIILHVL